MSLLDKMEKLVQYTLYKINSRELKFKISQYENIKMPEEYLLNSRTERPKNARKARSQNERVDGL